MGQSFQSGVLSALDLDLGWDARSADLIVGTSAGSLTGAALRLGIAVPEIAAWSVGHPAASDQAVLVGLGAIREHLPKIGLRSLVRPWRLPNTQLIRRSLTRPWSIRPLALLASVAPAGGPSLMELAGESSPTLIDPGQWPEGLIVCAVRRLDGMREAFGVEGAAAATLTTAVAASCAIPSYLAPVAIGGIDYVDGGIHSPTNADLLAHEGLDLVIIVSPMSGGSGIVDAAVRGFARHRLHAEVHALRANGTEVVVFEPDRMTGRIMGINPMAVERTQPTLRAAFFSAGERVARDSGIRSLLAQPSRGEGTAA